MAETWTYWCSNCGAKVATSNDVRPECGACERHPTMKAHGREDMRKRLPHPDQPSADDGNDVTRYKPNAIVRFLLDKGPFDMNVIALGNFTVEDRQQFAQLIGYSVSGCPDYGAEERENS